MFFFYFKKVFLTGMLFIMSLFVLKANGHFVDSLTTNFKDKGFTQLEIADNLGSITRTYMFGNPRLAIEIAHKARQIYLKQGDELNASHVDALIAEIYVGLRLSHIALEYYLKAFEVQHKLDDGDGLAWTYVNIGNLYFSEKLYELAQDYYDKALPIFQKYKHIHGQSVVYLNYGLIHRDNNNLDSALFYFDKVKDLREQLNDDFLVSHILNYIVNVYASKKEFEKALSLSHEAIKRLDNCVHFNEACIHQKYSSFFTLSNVYKLKEDYDSALVYIDSSFVFAKSLNDTLAYIDIYAAKARVYLNVNNYDSALFYYRMALDYSENQGFIEVQARYTLIMISIYVYKKDFVNAQFFLEKYYDIQKIVEQDKYTNQLISLKVAVETLSKDKDILYLREQEKSRLYLIYFLLFAALIFIALTIYVYYFRLKNAEKINKIIDNIFDGVIIHDNGKIIKVNDAFLKFSSYTKKELKQLDIFDIISDDIHNKIRVNILENKKNFYRTKILTKSGEYYDVEIEASTINYMGKKIRLLTIRDVREQHKFHEQSVLFQTIIEQNYSVIVITDINGRIEYVNPSFTQVTGYSSEEAIGLNPNVLKSGFHDKAFYDNLWHTLTKGDSWHGVFKNIDKYGKYYWEDATITPIKDKTDKIIKYVAIKQDISKKMALEEKHKAFIKQLSVVFNNLESLVLVINLNTEKIIFLNKKSQKDLNISQDATYKDAFFLNTKDHFVPIPLEELNEGSKGFTVRKEVFVDKLNNWFDFNFQLINWMNNENAVLVMAHNVSERKNQIDRLNELNATKDKFFSIVAHDLKNPFQGLLGVSDMLLHDIDLNDTEKVKMLVTHIYDASKSSYRLLENLLEWAKSQIGLVKIEPEEINLSQIVNKNLELLSKYAKDKQLSVINEVTEDLSAFSDKYVIDTVLRNLISNAIKFTSSGGKITVSTEQLQNEIVFSVKDSGLGIPTEMLDKLFRIDSKFSVVGTSGEKGNGIGLILCKELIEKNGGRIFVKSQYGEGSTFSFTIPILK